MSEEPRYADDDQWPWTAKLCRERQHQENVALRAELAEQGKPRQMRFDPDYSTIRGTSVFVQWKGTDVCLDFTCECGAGGHFDGEFAYQLRCSACSRVWDMPHSFALIPQQRFEHEIIQDVEMDLPVQEPTEER